LNNNYTVSIFKTAFPTYSSIQEVILGESVTSIGDNAFSDCSELTSIIIPNSVTSIGESAFKGCGELIYTSYDNGLYLGNDDNQCYALIKATNTSIISCEVYNQTKIIADGAFSNCSGLISITIPSSVSRIGNDAFSGCDQLSITFVGSIEPSCYDSGMFKSVCVPMGYNSISFCNKNFSEEEFIQQYKQCNEMIVCSDGNVFAPSSHNGTELVNIRDDNCYEYQCDNEGRIKSWSSCNSTNEVTRICMNNECIEEDKINDNDGWIISVDLVDVNADVLNETEIISLLGNINGINTIKFRIGTEINDKGQIKRIIIYTTDEQDAQTIANALDNCSSEHSNTIDDDSASICEGIFEHVQKAYVNTKDLSVSETYHNQDIMALLYIMSISLMMIAVFI